MKEENLFSSEAIAQISFGLTYFTVLLAITGLYMQLMQSLISVFMPISNPVRWLITLSAGMLLIFFMGIFTPIILLKGEAQWLRVLRAWAGGEVKSDLATYDVRVLLRGTYSWKKGESRIIRKVINGEVKDVDYEEELKPHLNDLIPVFAQNTFTDLIAVGAASHELGTNGRPFEENRGLERGISVSQTLLKLPITQDVYILNLGYYTRSPKEDYPDLPPDSSYQRPIVIVGVKNKKKGITKEEFEEDARNTLKDKLKQKEFKFNFDAYTRFDLKPSS
jgi:hypothetical protein